MCSWLFGSFLVQEFLQVEAGEKEVEIRDEKRKPINEKRISKRNRKTKTG